MFNDIEKIPFPILEDKFTITYESLHQHLRREPFLTRLEKKRSEIQTPFLLEIYTANNLRLYVDTHACACVSRDTSYHHFILAASRVLNESNEIAASRSGPPPTRELTAALFKLPIRISGLSIGALSYFARDVAHFSHSCSWIISTRVFPRVSICQ